MDARFRAVFYGARRIRGDIRERSVLTSRKSQHVQTILADPLAQVGLIDSALLDQSFTKRWVCDLERMHKHVKLFNVMNMESWLAKRL
ncbi:MAG: hypothetical protein QOG61_1553 [Candidatus Binataceae bacterium]|nr:hypothetical protein [Candidatus Binataceae bacterium]